MCARLQLGSEGVEGARSLSTPSWHCRLMSLPPQSTSPSTSFILTSFPHDLGSTFPTSPRPPTRRDFGSIFSTLLPGTTAKLDPPEGQDFLAGLEVKVAFGGVWKHSLSELSGGQRSLLALSLILALLLFKPAPLYILDEVDAALDLNHTQYIGHMIKQHFPHSQFIMVKEGMFNNENVIFRTKFIDGVSTVTRTVPSLPSSGAAGLSRAAPGAANGGRSRGAAASVARGKSAGASMR
ncbi:unnamed protein product [Closterium sp. Yama58-4]|nr:unnamed protein product [Closterium sp. Yama58-4]